MGRVRGWVSRAREDGQHLVRVRVRVMGRVRARVRVRVWVSVRVRVRGWVRVRVRGAVLERMGSTGFLPRQV